MTDHTINSASIDLLIINRQENVSSYRGVLISTEQARKEMYSLIKQGKAKLLIDTEQTLMYEILD
jgi:hypothetical protein